MSKKLYLLFFTANIVSIYSMEPLEIKAYSDLVQNSENFLKNNGMEIAPTIHNRISVIGANDVDIQNIILKHAKGACTIAHHRCRPLIEAYLEFKNAYGTKKEKRVYKSIHSPDDFISICMNEYMHI